MIASKLLLAVYFSTILIPLAVAILLNVKQKEMVKKHDFKNHVFADHKQELRFNKLGKIKNRCFALAMVMALMGVFCVIGEWSLLVTAPLVFGMVFVLIKHYL